MNQGILAAQFRESDSKLKTMLEALSSPTLQGIFFAERTVAEVLEGDCKTAIGIFAQEIAPSTMSLTCEVYNPHAPTSMRATRTFPFQHWHAEAQGLAQELLAQGVKALMS
jgi:porphobilinogen deaminase